LATYRAIQVAPDGSLQPTRRELAGPSAGHVRINVEACGVCHSNASSVHAHPATEASVVPGHEAVGRIDAIGDGVTGWSVGDRVCVGFLGGHCGVCEQCRRGNFTACTDQPVTGRTTDGAYAEYLYARQSRLVAIPAPLSSVAAAPLPCAGFTTCNALLKAPLKPGGLVAVQGIGGLGHLGLQYARKMGANVVAIARGTAKADLSPHRGADHYIDAATDVGAELTKLGGAGHHPRYRREWRFDDRAHPRARLRGPADGRRRVPRTDRGQSPGAYLRRCHRHRVADRILDRERGQPPVRRPARGWPR
jgi:propanol-preferring alcohol dehydrogenase